MEQLGGGGAHLKKMRRAEGGRHENIWGICLSLSISNSFPVYVHAVFHFVSPLHNLYFGKHNKGDKSYKFMLQVANFHR